MKFAKSIARIATVSLYTIGFATASFAGSGLSIPRGLAVDAAESLGR